MRYRLRELPRLLSTSIGRRNLYRLFLGRAWPLLRHAAGLHRRTLASRTRVVTVVGSFGKTTTAAAIAAVLDQPVLPGNAWGRIALSVLRIRPGQRHAVLEIGIDGPGQMVQYAPVARPDIVVVTAIGSEHNRSLGSLDDTAREKAQILQGLRPGGLAVLNGDDPRVHAMAARTRARVLTFGLGPGNDVRGEEVRLDWPHGMRLAVRFGTETRELRTRLLGRVMAYPILAAIAVAWAEGRPLDRVVAALEALPPVAGRLQLVPLPGGAWLIRDDFKSSLETIDAALDLLAEVPARRIVVLGEISEPVGSQGPHYHRLGERLAAIASRAIFVGGNFQRYATGAVRAGMARSALIDAGRGVREAAEAAAAGLGPGDVVLVKGRDTQRLDRVALALQGRKVACRIESCALLGVRCETCPKLETGWATEPSLIIRPFQHG